VKVLITGAAGQVGRALLGSAPAIHEVIATTRQQLELTDRAAIKAAVVQLQPDVVINAAAYTAVDKAESDAAAARTINADAVRWLAEAIAELPGSRLLHISTDFVFDGMQSVPYVPHAATAPLGVYGSTKLAGERAVAEIFGDRGTVLRTSWVYDAIGRNFVNTMLRLMREGKPLRVVADQIGSPTSAGSTAAVLWKFVSRPDLSGIWHWSDAGVASWYDFAVAIGEEGHALGLLKTDPAVTPIPTSEYPTPAKRPGFSVLDKQATIDSLGLAPVHWRHHLRQVLKEIASA
jgi:dTDP-4-dehydrorhamnose reductase